MNNPDYYEYSICDNCFRYIETRKPAKIINIHQEIQERTFCSDKCRREWITYYQENGKPKPDITIQEFIVEEIIEPEPEPEPIKPKLNIITEKELNLLKSEFKKSEDIPIDKAKEKFNFERHISSWKPKWVKETEKMIQEKDKNIMALIKKLDDYNTKVYGKDYVKNQNLEVLKDDKDN